MHSFCMVARVINISPLCSGWGLPTGNGLYATLRAPRQPSRSLYPQYCFDNPHFTCLPRICHNQWMCQWIIIYAPVIRVWKWRKVLARLWSIADQMLNKDIWDQNTELTWIEWICIIGFSIMTKVSIFFFNFSSFNSHRFEV